jgi:hypothetical protein
VGRLEQRAVLAVVRPGGDAEPADQARGQVGDDVAVQVREHQDVVQVGLLHELHAHVVDDPVLELDVRELLGDLPRDAQVEAVGVLHDVRLVHRRDLAAALAAGVLEGEADDPLGAGDRERLDRDARVGLDPGSGELLDPADQVTAVLRALLELDARVQVLGVLADDDQVDVVVARAHAGVRLARPDLGVQVERLAQRDVDRAKPRPHRRGHGALDGHLRAPDRVQHRVGERRAALGHHVRAGVLDLPVELHAGGLQHPSRRLGDLGSGPVAGDQGHMVGQGGTPLSRKRRGGARPAETGAFCPIASIGAAIGDVRSRA